MPINKMRDSSGKLIKKDGLQKYRVRVNYVDGYGKYKQITRTAFGSDAAKLLEMEMLHSLEKETPAARMTLQSLFDEYIASKKHEVRASSLDKTKRTLELYVIGSDLKDVCLSKLNVRQLQKWKMEIEENGLAFNTRVNIYKQFRAMLNYAVKMEYLPNNPLLKVGNFKAPLEMKKEMDFYTYEEFKKFIAAARQEAEESGSLSAWGYYVFFCIAFFTGARKGEINALTWNDVQGGEIRITKSVCQKLHGEDIITPPKNQSSIRTIGIPAPLQAVLDEFYTLCKNSVDNFGNDYNVCVGVRALRDTAIENANKHFAEVAGVKKIRIHDFRHSHASLLVHEGINIQEVARRLGHADISMTLKTYSHLYPKESERALSVLNNLENPKK